MSNIGLTTFFLSPDALLAVDTANKSGFLVILPLHEKLQRVRSVNWPDQVLVVNIQTSTPKLCEV